MTDNSHKICTYAALLLHDAGKPLTEENIANVVAAAKCTTQPYWPMLFAKLFKTSNIEELLFKPGGGAAAGGAGAAAAAGGEAVEEEKEEEPEEEEEEVAMGGLMGGDDDAGW